MCTSLTYTSDKGHHFLARTMDFGFELEATPVLIPRNYEWSTYLGEYNKTKFGFVGTGKKLEQFIVADGVNEHGLAIAELYFLHEASYAQSVDPSKLNLAPHELISWVLGEIESIEDLKKRKHEIQITEAPVSLLGIVVPLHYIITDRTGATVVIETIDGELLIKDNPVGVMSNSPELEWHLKNLTNYLSIKPTNFPNRMLNDYEVKPFGQGSGTFGLPGGYTSPERFVRTVYARSLTKCGVITEDSLNAIFHILNNVTISKGVNVKDDGSLDYTQYRAVIDVTSLTYYFNPYSTQEIFSVSLTEENLSTSQPIEFELNSTFKVTALN